MHIPARSKAVKMTAGTAVLLSVLAFAACTNTPEPNMGALLRIPQDPAVSALMGNLPAAGSPRPAGGSSSGRSATIPVFPDPSAADGSFLSVPVSAEIPALTQTQEKLLAGAYHFLGSKNLTVNGRRYNYDCTGTILAIYAWAGIDLAREFGKYSGNGVTRLYLTMKNARLLYDTERPVPGDIIFWDNTYDRNGDGRWNDPLTHAGMVTDITADGTVSYIHLNYRKGITVEYMNLLRPDVNRNAANREEVNSPMRMKSDRGVNPGLWLAGQLYKTSAKGYLF